MQGELITQNRNGCGINQKLKTKGNSETETTVKLNRHRHNSGITITTTTLLLDEGLVKCQKQKELVVGETVKPDFTKCSMLLDQHSSQPIRF